MCVAGPLCPVWGSVAWYQEWDRVEPESNQCGVWGQGKGVSEQKPLWPCRAVGLCGE